MRQLRKLKEQTSALRRWCRDAVSSHRRPFEAARSVCRRLGARVAGEAVEFGFWIPAGDPQQPAWLEVFIPLQPVAARPWQTLRLRRSLVQLEREGDFAWAAVDGVPAGDGTSQGAFYWLRRGGPAGAVMHDCFAASLPFGSFAPAEVYDLETVQGKSSQNRETSADEPPPRLATPSNILEIHVETATPSGTLAGLNHLFRGIAAKLRSGAPLGAREKLFLGYDAVELLPLEPVAEPRRSPSWRFVGPSGQKEERHVRLRRPEISNWGYDTLIAGFPAVNPSLLSGGRPHELAELAATLRNFPTGPIRLIFDVVLGHAHRQAERLLDPLFFAGTSLYGKSLNYRHPVVRAILLEMLRRKLNWGADGVRVDASQDIKIAEPGSKTKHDDDFLDLIAETMVETGGRRYHPFVIFEDGRPWPRPDWKLTATCRDVLQRQPHALQWSPWTFASNLPLNPTFWIGRKWRLDETARHGSRWVTGCSNHDTLRRGAASPPAASARPGLPTFAEAYDNPAALMLTHGFLPGIPMDFLQASARAPWTFFRNAEDHILKTVCQEIEAVVWLVGSADYRRRHAFPRLKGLGLSKLAQLRRFARQVQSAALLADSREGKTAAILRAAAAPEISPSRFCRAWMADFRDHCRVHAGPLRAESKQVEFHGALRRFRLGHRWLGENLRHGDIFEHLWDYDGAVVYRGRRRSPDGRLEIQIIANLTGEMTLLSERDLPSASQDWRMTLRTPANVGLESHRGSRLKAGQGLLWTRVRAGKTAGVQH